jgi:hypothetical protein
MIKEQQCCVSVHVIYYWIAEYQWQNLELSLVVDEGHDDR